MQRTGGKRAFKRVVRDSGGCRGETEGMKDQEESTIRRAGGGTGDPRGIDCAERWQQICGVAAKQGLKTDGEACFTQYSEVVVGAKAVVVTAGRGGGGRVWRRWRGSAWLHLVCRPV